jgi:hypothetical protein
MGKFNREVNHLYSTPNDVRVIKARRMSGWGMGGEEDCSISVKT